MDSNCDILRIAASYNEWKKMGCQVLKGQTSLRHRNGVAQFEIWQTIPILSYESLTYIDRLLDAGVMMDGMDFLDEDQYH